MPNYTYLIIGGGMTGDAAIGGIREVDPKGSIGLIGADSHRPYFMIVPNKMKHSVQGEYLDFLGRGMTQPQWRSASQCLPRSQYRRPARFQTPAQAGTRARPWAGLSRGSAG